MWIMSCKDARVRQGFEIWKDGWMGMAISWRNRTLLLSYLIALAHEFHRADESEEIPNTIGAHPNLLYPVTMTMSLGKVWRAVTTFFLSLGLQLNLYDRLNYRSDIEESCGSSPFSCLSMVAELLTPCETDDRRVPSATTSWPYQTLSRFESPILCSFLLFFFSFCILLQSKSCSWYLTVFVWIL